MARPTNNEILFRSFIDLLVVAVAARLEPGTTPRKGKRNLSPAGRARISAAAKKRWAKSRKASGESGASKSKPARRSTVGRKLDMDCRYPGCENRSKGPRFRFLCEEHLKLPKSEQDAALAKASA